MPYDESKWKEFNEMIEEQRKHKDCHAVVLAKPELLGDTYEEIVENLKRLGAVGLMVSIQSGCRRSNCIRNRIKRYLR